MKKKLDAIEAIEKGFDLIRRKPIIFFISAIFHISFISAYMFISSEFLHITNRYFGFGLGLYKQPLIVIVIFNILLILFSNFIFSLMIKVAHEERISILKATKFVLSKYPTLLISTILFFLILLGGFIALIIPGIFLFVKLFFYQYAIIIENKGIITSLERSWEITKNNWLRVFGLGVLLLNIVIFILIINYLLIFISFFLAPFLIVSAIFYIVSSSFLSSLYVTSSLEAFKTLSIKR